VYAIMTLMPDQVTRSAKQIARVLAFHQGVFYAELGGCIARSSDQGRTWEGVVRLPRSVAGLGRLHRRLLRLGVHACAVMPGGSLVLVVRKRIWSYNAVTGSLAEVFTIPRGSRPLVLCQTEDNLLYFGEYWSNPDREAVNIYAATYPQLDFKPVYCFPPGVVRHVHGVFADPYAHALWVTTGDLGREAAIWRSDDQLATLTPVLIGGQQSRAVGLLFTASHVYFGTDTPSEQNYVYRFDRMTGAMERLVAVQGSVFYGCKVGETLVFATVVEPSKINNTSQAFLWASRDGINWSCLRGYHKDRWPLKLFQYGQILFPTGVNATETLWHTPLGTQLDQTIQRMDLEFLCKDS
jgi:hypothetical protein